MIKFYVGLLVGMSILLYNGCAPTVQPNPECVVRVETIANATAIVQQQDRVIQVLLQQRAALINGMEEMAQEFDAYVKEHPDL